MQTPPGSSASHGPFTSHHNPASHRTASFPPHGLFSFAPPAGAPPAAPCAAAIARPITAVHVDKTIRVRGDIVPPPCRPPATWSDRRAAADVCVRVWYGIRFPHSNRGESIMQTLAARNLCGRVAGGGGVVLFAAL